MTELLRNAWNGWRAYTDPGKLAALLLISLVFLWIYYKRVPRKEFLIYTTVAVVCCIFPVTAAALMLYQTRFYDYEWIWSIVPLTAMVSYGVVLFVTEFLKEQTRGDRKKEMAVVLLLLAALALSGGMGAEPWDDAGEQEAQRQSEEVLTALKERMAGREICLWAPREILEYAREWDGGITLLYGRDMWEPALNAYAYDVYPSELTEVYEWMEGIGEEPVSVRECAETVKETPVNCILLPGTADEETLACFGEVMGLQAEELGSYYLWIR